jgi:tetratricopeptide (TPR) repeat protein
VDWQPLYWAGQSYRSLNDCVQAVHFLKRAAAAAPTVAPVFLALGIALQGAQRLSEAKEALARAIEIDNDYALAFNSLALTQKLGGEFEKALHNYDAGCLALARRIVKYLRNHRDNSILKHRDTRGSLWCEYASFGALYLTSCEQHLTGIVFPTGEHAAEEERTESHRGLYWEDVRLVDSDGLSRMFLPNYFNTFREALKQDSTYATLVGNRSTVLRLLDRDSEADEHATEAGEFMPTAGLR